VKIFIELGGYDPFWPPLRSAIGFSDQAYKKRQGSRGFHAGVLAKQLYQLSTKYVLLNLVISHINKGRPKNLHANPCTRFPLEKGEFQQKVTGGDP
jgi:hypothetical protein